MSIAVLITGTSTGIGRAATQRLARRRDLTVYATARRTQAIADLADTGARILALDVTDEESMRTAVAKVEAEHGSVGALVNNAGYGEYGPVEEMPAERARAQFETNVFGLARMTQLVLPGMRAAGRGRIINISSVGGRVTFPGGGWYHASKYAVEALSDALRFETAPFGIQVSLVEPGLIKTEFGNTATTTLAGNDTGAGPYGKLTAALNSQFTAGYSSRMAVEPDRVAAVIEKALTTRRPRPRYVTAGGARTALLLHAVLGDRGWDAAMRMRFR